MVDGGTNTRIKIVLGKRTVNDQRLTVISGGGGGPLLCQRRFGFSGVLYGRAALPRLSVSLARLLLALLLLITAWVEGRFAGGKEAGSEAGGCGVKWRGIRAVCTSVSRWRQSVWAAVAIVVGASPLWHVNTLDAKRLGIPELSRS